MTHELVLICLATLAVTGCPGDDTIDSDAGDSEARDVLEADSAPNDTGAGDVAMDRDEDDIVDASPTDGGQDAGSLDPEWIRMPGLPEFCTLERAVHPERLSHPMWEDCGPGCEWLVPHPTHVRTPQRASGHHDGEKGYAWVHAYPIAYDAYNRRYSTWIMDSDGNVLAAWRRPSSNELTW